MPHLNPRVVRRSLRALVLTPAVLVPFAAAPAFASAPQSWENATNPSVFDFLLVLLIIPAGLALVIALLASLPYIVHGDKYKPGRAWRNENEWFGGPKDGLEATDQVDPQTVRRTEAEAGGASARW